ETRYNRRYLDLMINEDMRKVLLAKNDISKYIRSYLSNQNFVEVETPVMSSSVGGGCEFYMAYADYSKLMKMTEDMLSGLVKEITGDCKIKYHANGYDKEPIEIDFTPPYRRLDMIEELKKAAQLKIPKDLASKEANTYLIDACLVGKYVEEMCVNPTFIINHPVIMSPFAKRDYSKLMKMTEDMLSGLVKEITGDCKIKYHANGYDKEPIEIDFTPPYRRLDMIEELKKAAQLKIPKDLASKEANTYLIDACVKLNVNCPSPQTTSRLLAKLVGKYVEEMCVNPTFIINHPVIMSPFAKRDYSKLMKMTEDMLSGLVKEITGDCKIKYHANGYDKEPIEIDFTPPYRRLDMIEELEKAAQLKIPKDLASKEANTYLIDVCVKLNVNCPSPQTTSRLLAKLVGKYVEEMCVNPTFIINHPVIMSPFAKRDYSKLMKMTEDMLSGLVKEITGDCKIKYHANGYDKEPIEIDFTPPYRRLDMIEELEKAAQLKIPKDLASKEANTYLIDTCVKLNVNCPSPQTTSRLLAKLVGKYVEEMCVNPTFIINHPVIMSPFAKRDYSKLMKMTEDMLSGLVKEITGDCKIKYHANGYDKEPIEIDFTPPYRRLDMIEELEKAAQLKIPKDLASKEANTYLIDACVKLNVNCPSPQTTSRLLAKLVGKYVEEMCVNPTFIINHPVIMSPFAKRDYSKLMKMTEDMLSGLVKEITGDCKIKYHANGYDKEPIEIDFTPPYRRLDMIEELEKAAQLKIPKDLASKEANTYLIDACVKLNVNCPSPQTTSRLLAKLVGKYVEEMCVNPTFIINHPVIMSPFAKRDYSKLMKMTEDMLSGLVKEITGDCKIKYHANGYDKEPIEIDFTPPYRRLDMIEELEKAAQLKIPKDLASKEANTYLIDTCVKLNVNCPSPQTTSRLLAKLVGKYVEEMCVNPTFIINHPVIMSPFAKRDYSKLMKMTEDMLSGLVKEITGDCKIKYHANGYDKEPIEIDFTPPYRRLDMIEELEKAAQLKIPKDLASKEANTYLIDACVKLNVNCPSPRTTSRLLAKLVGKYVEEMCVNPTFIINHPVIMSPFAKSHRYSDDLTERFELYIVKQELCNAYTELNNPVVQRERFAHQLRERESGDEEAMVLDESFCVALEHGLPPTSGWGMGIDRLTMLLTDSLNIRDVISFPTTQSGF
ncbi:unnamed protein product, partial [Arabidopsis halleri]